MNNIIQTIKNVAIKYKLIFFIIIFVLLFCHIYSIENKIANADLSTMVLFSDDILNGNIFLNNWYLSGLTFLATDMLYFLLSVKLFGISSSSIFCALSLYITMCFISAFLLIRNDIKKITILDLIMFILLCGISFESIRLATCHNGCFVYSYLTIFFTAKYLKNQQNKYLFYSSILLILSVFSDYIIFMTAIVPILVYSCFQMFYNNDNKKYLNIIFSIVISIITGYFLLKVYIYNSTLEYNGEPAYFININIDAFTNKIILIVKELSLLFDIDCLTNKLLNINAIISLLRYIIIFLGIHLIYKNIEKCITNKNPDFVNFCLSLSVVLFFIIFLTTSYNSDIHTARYISFMPLSFAVLILREFSCFDNISKKQYILIFCLLLILLLNTLYCNTKKNDDRLELANRIISILEKNNLTNGINIDYWMSTSVTVFSKNKIKIRPIYLNPENRLEKFTWYTKEDWFNEPVQFVIINSSTDNAENFNDSVLSMKSKEIIDIHTYKIYILNKPYNNYYSFEEEINAQL